VTAGPPRVVTFGELLLRLSPVRQEALFQSPALRAGFGGAEANVAVGLAQLGIPCAYVTRLPANPIGDAALERLREEGVDTRWVTRGPERMGIYFIELGDESRPTRVVYDRAGSAFAHITADAIDWGSALGGAAWLHSSGITPALGEGPARTLAAGIATARAAGLKLSLDLNYRPALWQDRDPRPLIEPLALGLDLLIGNATAVREMLGVDVDERSMATPDGRRGLARRLAEELGCRRIALTRRELLSESEHGWSAALYDATAGTIASSRRYQVRVVDRVGGGDSFAAALIASLLGGRSDTEAVQFAVAASALKLTIPGDFNRVTTAEVEELVRSGRTSVAAPAEGVGGVRR
jgi:2-dehydro-3-deoxygluconokinase